MGPYIARRLAWTPFLLLIITFVTFALGRFGPGDPVQILQGQYSNPDVVQRIREQRGLDDNIFVQYSRYMRDLSRGDFGESFKYRNQHVGELLKKRMWVSAQLAFAALVISVGLGIPAGVFAALRQGTSWDTGVVALTLVGQSMPVFLTAPGLLIIFALKLDILPTHGWGGFFDARIILPAAVMGIPRCGDNHPADPFQHTRRGNPRLHTDGPGQGIGGKHRAPAAHSAQRIDPRGYHLGFLTGRVGQRSGHCRRIFWNSRSGLLAIESLFSRDYNVIMALTVIGTTAFVLANLLVDLAYPLLDPRIRLGSDYVAG